MHRMSLLGITLVFIALAFNGIATPQTGDALEPLVGASTSGTETIFPFVAPIAPGAYTGPGDEAIPPGWSPWTKDNHRQCGDLRLVFANKDLKEDENGVLHAQGSFFIQFQAVGERAHEITRFSFSFGKSVDSLQDNPPINCNELVPDNPLGKGTAGVYIPFYRSDFDYRNGFFIPIETRNVPDGQYAAAVHAYIGEFPDYIEVARAWAFADVVNCDGTGTSGNYCNGADWDDDETVIANDLTQPWMWVLPGDGRQTHDVNGLTIEILEPVESIRALLNGEEITLQEWTPPPRDRDVLPMNDEEGCVTNLPPVCNHMIYSHGWKWEGTLQQNDLVFVEATDRNGNEVFKSLILCANVVDSNAERFSCTHPDLPLIQFNPITHPFQSVNSGETKRFDMRIENLGADEAHVDFYLDYNKTHLNAQWEDMSYDHGHPTHLHLYPGQVLNTYVDVVVPTDTPNGVYKIEAYLEDPAGGEWQRDAVMLDLTVQGGAPPPVENETDEEPELEDTPLPFAVVVIAAALVALGAAARRRSG